MYVELFENGNRLTKGVVIHILQGLDMEGEGACNSKGASGGYVVLKKSKAKDNSCCEKTSETTSDDLRHKLDPTEHIDGIVDLREPNEYELQHIVGSTNLPWSQIEDRLHELPPRVQMLDTESSDKFSYQRVPIFPSW